jgi:hypothetical protein
MKNCDNNTLNNLQSQELVINYLKHYTCFIDIADALYAKDKQLLKGQALASFLSKLSILQADEPDFYKKLKNIVGKDGVIKMREILCKHELFKNYSNLATLTAYFCACVKIKIIHEKDQLDVSLFKDYLAQGLQSSWIKRVGDML